MLTLQRRQHVGHDILLARHGNHICSMRLDRSAGRVIALLDDGSVDSAPNVISPDLQLPETIQSVMREDWKFLATVTGSVAALAGVMIAAAFSLAGLSADPALTELMTTYPAY